MKKSLVFAMFMVSLLCGCSTQEPSKWEGPLPWGKSVNFASTVSSSSQVSLWSESLVFTNFVNFSIDGRYDTPVAIKSIHITFSDVNTNAFVMKRIRPLGAMTNVDVLLNPSSSTYTTYSYYFDNDIVYKPNDRLFVTNTSTRKCVLTYDYLKGVK